MKASLGLGEAPAETSPSGWCWNPQVCIPHWHRPHAPPPFLTPTPISLQKRGLDSLTRVFWFLTRSLVLTSAPRPPCRPAIFLCPTDSASSSLPHHIPRPFPTLSPMPALPIHLDHLLLAHSRPPLSPQQRKIPGGTASRPMGGCGLARPTQAHSPQEFVAIP